MAKKYMHLNIKFAHGLPKVTHPLAPNRALALAATLALALTSTPPQNPTLTLTLTLTQPSPSPSPSHPGQDASGIFTELAGNKPVSLATKALLKAPPSKVPSKLGGHAAAKGAKKAPVWKPPAKPKASL